MAVAMAAAMSKGASKSSSKGSKKLGADGGMANARSGKTVLMEGWLTKRGRLTNDCQHRYYRLYASGRLLHARQPPLDAALLDDDDEDTVTERKAPAKSKNKSDRSTTSDDADATRECSTTRLQRSHRSRRAAMAPWPRAHGVTLTWRWRLGDDDVNLRSVLLIQPRGRLRQTKRHMLEASSVEAAAKWREAISSVLLSKCAAKRSRSRRRRQPNSGSEREGQSAKGAGKHMPGATRGTKNGRGKAKRASKARPQAPRKGNKRRGGKAKRGGTPPGAGRRSSTTNAPVQPSRNAEENMPQPDSPPRARWLTKIGSLFDRAEPTTDTPVEAAVTTNL